MQERERQPRLGPDRRVNRLFDRVAVIFLSMLSERRSLSEAAVPRLTTERFHWDAANEEFHWTGADSVGRNVNVYLTTPGAEGEEEIPATVPLESGYSGLVVEINAWKDDERVEEEGTRHSRHEVIDRLKPPFRTDRLHSALDRAYSRVSNWREEDLTRESPLSPRPLPWGASGFPGHGDANPPRLLEQERDWFHRRPTDSSGVSGFPGHGSEEGNSGGVSGFPGRGSNE